MYWLTPFKYLLEGLLGLVTHGQPVQCADSEMARFPAPPSQTCDSYAGPYIAQAGGYVTTMSDGLCGICQYANGDEFAASFNVYYRVSLRPNPLHLTYANGIISVHLAGLWLICGLLRLQFCGGSH